MLSNRQRAIAKSEVKQAINFVAGVISEQMVDMVRIDETVQQFKDGAITSTELANYILNAHDNVRSDVTHRLLIRLYKENPSMADSAFERIERG